MAFVRGGGIGGRGRRYTGRMHLSWLLALVGCGCPDFADIEVAADDTVADPDRSIATVEGAIADFAAWTQRAGVCVDHVDIRDEVIVQRLSGPLRVGGYYESDGTGIVLADTVLGEATRHELCHALDKKERLSLDNADLFPPEDVDVVPGAYVNESMRIRESFARACEETPSDLTLLDAASVACGVDFVDERTHFLDEVVYPGFPEGLPVEPGAPRPAPEWRPIDVPVGHPLVAISGSPRGLQLLVRAYRPTRDGHALMLRLLDVDVDTGVVTRRWQHPVRWLTSITPVPSDTEDTLVLLTRELHRIDASGRATVWTSPDDVEWAGPAALSGGVLYAATWDGEVRAWHFGTGIELTLPPHGLDVLGGPLALWPTDGGVEVEFDEGFARFAHGEWTLWPSLPEAAYRGAGTGDTRDFLVYTPTDTAHPATLDLATGAWTVRPVCDAPLTDRTSMVTAAGRTWALAQDEDGLSIAELDP